MTDAVSGFTPDQPVAPRVPSGQAAGDSVINEFASYEDYLDSQITLTDLFYLEVILEDIACIFNL